ncbi:hypothetical protein Tco_1449669 [Tanacetum coccineum]
MKRNLIPPQGVVGSHGLVITEPEEGIFYYNGNFDLVFQRENEPAECKASEGSEDPMSAKHKLMIKGLADSIASASNLRDIQVRDIIKKVEDYLKTYSPIEDDIRWYVEGML